MIVLDTNVVSELMKDAPDEIVARWVGEQAETMLYITAITQAEIFYGIERLPAGKRRLALEAAAEATFTEDFGGRVLGFGTEAARAFAEIAATRARSGRPISQMDAQIAAIVRINRATLATRDAGDYQGCGIKVVDPWNAVA